MTQNNLIKLQQAYTRWCDIWEMPSTGALTRAFCRYKMWRIKSRISSLSIQTTEDDGY